MSAPAEVEGLQSTLAAEHAAVWIYGVLGGQTSTSSQARLAKALGTAYALHRGRRDQLIRWVRDASETPVAAEVAYELPNAASTATEIRATALEVEDRCCGAYADMVGRTTGAQRTWAINALIDAAKREMSFGGVAEVLPGIPD